ncbi:hypothetical protein D3OALGA1CA_2510 [Olavius algarvensis associated proteobacterium Delta 3]|nr:hypothetical protein D3OALGA1CA_2510 [Olavius algarvensis associated proteobacterium Delta 3]CAB5137607.1 hypothetical protein D3OALGB2SA_4031 [Olavius algarvensis associated proteobacterium Delta 3]
MLFKQTDIGRCGNWEGVSIPVGGVDLCDNCVKTGKEK